MNSLKTHTCDILVIGGGVIGLTLARELSKRGAKVVVVERGKVGREASWAGAGMLPPGVPRSHWNLATPLQQMMGLSGELQAELCAQLESETGIDSEFRKCGSLRFATTQDEMKSLRNEIDEWRQLGITCQEVDTQQASELEPHIHLPQDSPWQAYFVRDESQLRNPRYLSGLAESCRRRGVELIENSSIESFEQNGDRITSAESSNCRITAARYCVATGSWSAHLLQSMDVEAPVKPIRGQIVLLRGSAGLLNGNVYRGLEYLAPRLDGRILVGSTMEDVGFEKANTPEGTDSLLRFAHQFVPATAKCEVENRWSGLRPGTTHGQPIMGRAPRFDNVWIATGHLRAGLLLAPATAVLMSDLIEGRQPEIDVAELALS